MTAGVLDKRAFTVLTMGKEAEVEELIMALRQIDGAEASFRAGQDGVRVVVRRGEGTFSVSIYPVSEGAIERLIAMYLNDWSDSQEDSEGLTERVWRSSAGRAPDACRRMSSSR